MEPDKIQGANKGDRLSDFAAQPPTSCWNINSSVSLWLREGKTPCVLVLCRGHVVIGGCAHAASRTEKQAKLDLYDAATWILCVGTLGELSFLLINIQLKNNNILIVPTP